MRNHCKSAPFQIPSDLAKSVGYSNTIDRSIIGADIFVGGFSLNLMQGYVKLKDVTLMNPLDRGFDMRKPMLTLKCSVTISHSLGRICLTNRKKCSNILQRFAIPFNL
jgi:hypothetical protein